MIVRRYQLYVGQAPLPTAGGAIAGTATLSFGGSAALKGAGKLAGASSLTFGGSAALKGTGALAGASSLTFGGSAALKGAGKLAGTATLTFGGSASFGGNMAGTGTLSFAGNAAAVGWRLVGRPFLYTAANWNTVFYLEVEYFGVSGTIYGEVWNQTDGASVEESRVSTGSGSVYVRQRSGPAPLTDGKVYRVRFGRAGGSSGNYKSGTLIAY